MFEVGKSVPRVQRYWFEKLCVPLNGLFPSKNGFLISTYWYFCMRTINAYGLRINANRLKMTETIWILIVAQAQCLPADEAQFQDVQLHKYFNTNNLWINLNQLKQCLKKNNGSMPLPLIKNVKNVRGIHIDSNALWVLVGALNGTCVKVPPGRWIGWWYPIKWIFSWQVACHMLA